MQGEVWLVGWLVSTIINAVRERGIEANKVCDKETRSRR